MRMLHGNHWEGGFLDYHREPDEYRISVLAWRSLAPLDPSLPRRERSVTQNFRLLLQYLRYLGAGAALATVASRRREYRRKYREIACGLGRVVEGPPDGLPAGTTVAFLAPLHPACVERIVLPPSLISPIDERIVADLPPGILLYQGPAPLTSELRGLLDRLGGWSRFSGRPAPAISPELVRMACDLLGPDRQGSTPFRVGSAERVRETQPARTSLPPGAPAAVLIGYGQHARTLVIPAVRPHLTIDRVHEIDPSPIPRDDRHVTWTTSPHLPPAAALVGHRAVFIAGYHHSHAPLAEEALRAGLYAVVEKPIATTEADCDRLLSALGTHGPRLFACYHKRYHPFNDLARHDLRLKPGEPISYHCIVFEEPLPGLHWYRWPSSRTRIVSNGCHWIDHFLFLNEFSAPVHQHVEMLGNVLNCTVELQNGACFTMVLTDRGSTRGGVRNYVELRAGLRTVRIVDDTTYRAEDERRVARRAAIEKLSVYFGMYQTISRSIVRREPGDSMRSVEVSTRLVLAMDGLISRSRAARDLQQSEPLVTLV